ncbi:MAG: hypothetical protein AB1498_02740 [bacterium]
MFRNRIFKTFIGLGLVLVFFICGGPNCIPQGDDPGTGPTTGTVTVTGTGTYIPPPPPTGGGTGGNYNTPPWVTIIADRMSVTTNEMITIRADAGDPDNDPLVFDWFVSQGAWYPEPGGRSIRWTAPGYGTGVNVAVKVRDSKGAENKAEIFINVMMSGYVPPPTMPNQPPFFTDVHSDMNTVGPGGVVRLFANAMDPDYDPITYRWKMVGPVAGYFSNPGPDAQNCDWIAPNTSGMQSYEFACEARDTRGGFQESYHIFVYVNSSSGYNTPPYNFFITASKQYGLVAGEEISLTALAYDAENDPLVYYWESIPEMGGLPIGMFVPSPNGQNIKWQAPYISKASVWDKPSVWFNINCKVDDGNGHFDFRSLSIEVMTQ